MEYQGPGIYKLKDTLVEYSFLDQLEFKVLTVNGSVNNLTTYSMIDSSSGSEIYYDDVLVYENGAWLQPEYKVIQIISDTNVSWEFSGGWIYENASIFMPTDISNIVWKFNSSLVLHRVDSFFNFNSKSTSYSELDVYTSGVWYDNTKVYDSSSLWSNDDYRIIDIYENPNNVAMLLWIVLNGEERGFSYTVGWRYNSS